MKDKVQEALRFAVNSTSAEAGSNTNDVILAEYLDDCLQAFNRAVVAREAYYGRIHPNGTTIEALAPRPNEQPVRTTAEMLLIEKLAGWSATAKACGFEGVTEALGYLLGLQEQEMRERPATLRDVLRAGVPAATVAPKEYPCIESVFEETLGHYVVRVWRDQPSLVLACTADFADVQNLFLTRPNWLPEDLTREVAKLPRVNAVHVRRVGLNAGVIVYVNWP